MYLLCFSVRANPADPVPQQQEREIGALVLDLRNMWSIDANAVQGAHDSVSISNSNSNSISISISISNFNSIYISISTLFLAVLVESVIHYLERDILVCFVRVRPQVMKKLEVLSPLS